MRTVNTGTMRGLRIGAGPPGEPERGTAAPRVLVSYWCASKHETTPNFATGAVIPDSWVCRCGRPAALGQVPPDPPAFRADQTSHLDHVTERRSAADGAALLAWALDRLRSRHGITPSRPQAVPRREVDVHVPVTAATLPAVPEPVAATAAPAGRTARRQPRRQSRAQRQRSRKRQAG
jgi:hypothetical protein